MVLLANPQALFHPIFQLSCELPFLLSRVFYGLEHSRGASIVIFYRGRIVGGVLAAGDDADAVAFFDADDLPPLGFQATEQVLARWVSERTDSSDCV